MCDVKASSVVTATLATAVADTSDVEFFIVPATSAAICSRSDIWLQVTTGIPFTIIAFLSGYDKKRGRDEEKAMKDKHQATWQS